MIWYNPFWFMCVSVHHCSSWAFSQGRVLTKKEDALEVKHMHVRNLGCQWVLHLVSECEHSGNGTKCLGRSSVNTPRRVELRDTLGEPMYTSIHVPMVKGVVPCPSLVGSYLHCEIAPVKCVETWRKAIGTPILSKNHQDLLEILSLTSFWWIQK